MNLMFVFIVEVSQLEFMNDEFEESYKSEIIFQKGGK
jgi:hypothetical protein